MFVHFAFFPPFVFRPKKTGRTFQSGRLFSGKFSKSVSKELPHAFGVIASGKDWLGPHSKHVVHIQCDGLLVVFVVGVFRIGPLVIQDDANLLIRVNV